MMDWYYYVILGLLGVVVALLYDIATTLERSQGAPEKRIRQVLFDYLDYKEQHLRTGKLIDRASMKLSEVAFSEEYEALNWDRTLVQLQIQKREQEYKFLEKHIEFFDDLHDELRIIEEKLSNHPDREQIEKQRLDEFKKRFTDRKNKLKEGEE
jgi:hypothetical protein